METSSNLIVPNCSAEEICIQETPEETHAAKKKSKTYSRERLKQLALPYRYAENELHQHNEKESKIQLKQTTGVSRKALKYIPSERIKQLSQPKNRCLSDPNFIFRYYGK